MWAEDEVSRILGHLGRAEFVFLAPSLDTWEMIPEVLCCNNSQHFLVHKHISEALRLSNTAMTKTTTGQIVNLLSNDVNKFDQVTIFLHFLWAGPLQAVAVTVLLWLEIGPSCLAGMAVLIILLPLQTCFGRLFSSLRSRTASFTDVRIRTMNEVITGMRIIKMYAWEKSFADLVNSMRRREISMVLKSSYLRGLNLASFFVASKITVFMTFMTYVLLGNVISASRVFVAVSLYGAVRLTVTLFFPAAIEKASEAMVSIRRIKNFLILDEISELSPQLKAHEENGLLHVQDLTCFWDKTLEAPTLQNISFSIRRGELLVVVGPVGAGKSSVLSAILGELAASKGFVNARGRIAYVSQQPWVFSGTVRNNILFGKAYEKEKYEKVLRACALKKDLEMLPDGDLTVVGDRGATLSGGQKARVNLARAVYQDADIYLLDDPLSAVDAEVSRHLFENGHILGGSVVAGTPGHERTLPTSISDCDERGCWFGLNPHDACCLSYRIVQMMLMCHGRQFWGSLFDISIVNECDLSALS
ncbi:UNVERIFIED_CONTAM: Multidrug resistance-associated protein 4 [Gekko kuhli]